MATTDARPGFRLPWGSEQGSEADADQSTESAALDGDATGEPESSVPTESSSAETQSSDDAGPAPAIVGRPTRFMEELTKAMRVAAEAARDEALERLRTDAKAVVDAIHDRASTEADDLRRTAESDIAAIREALTDQIARIRVETDQRIAERQTGLEEAIEGQAARIEARLERVRTRATAFEDEMTVFFDRMLGEEDPARFAAYAQNVPEPPALDGELESDLVVAGVDASPEFDPWIGTTFATSTDAPAENPRLALLGSSDAAAAEAEAQAEAEATADVETASYVQPAAPLDEHVVTVEPEQAASDDELVTTRAQVVGLVSVASIAGFKRALGQVAGVRTVGVSSGPDGEFVFVVVHEPTVDLRMVVPGLQGFGARVSRADDGVIEIAARDPETAQ